MYREALRCTHNKELAAQCLLMLSVCDKAASEYHANMARSEKYIYADQHYSYSFPYVQQLRRRYMSTLTYSLAIAECPDVVLAK